ncbi:MAG TPA: DUF2270 domain-containing protein [Pirellulaceae bacterium]|nr:DUF2270 domain-containing protein [Pirellulaceae bacterium]HMO90631.1 DUF2270 domain-containing protein [Pirellulaceae bacterium]HMP67790.1 DUF2270 domain-containing protein [Pirellulaceae bacterium]
MVEITDTSPNSTILPQFEQAELTRSEYIATMVHFYRGELHRSTEWRLRLDTTTNWAIISVMALVTFSLGETSHSHIGILAGMALVFTFLTIETRRFRFFDVWRSRTRMLEENFIGAIVRRDLRSPIQNWGKLVAADLLWPKFKITWHQALKARLLRNYLPLFILLFVCWVLKISIPTEEPSLGFANLVFELNESRTNWAQIIASYISVAFVIGIYGYLAAVITFARRTKKAEEEYWQVGVELEELPELDT